MSEMERNNKGRDERRGGSSGKDRARENEMMFKRADVDRDGKVTRQEFNNMMNGMPGKEA